MKDSTKEISRNKVLIIIFCCISIMLLSSLFFNNAINKHFNSLNLTKFDNCMFKVHYLDIGQADCTIIQFPNNKTMLIDAGAETNNKTTPEYICDYIKNNILKSNIIDYVILTHSDEDHCYSMPAIFNTFEVKTVFRPATKAIFNNYEQIEDEMVNTCNSQVYANTIKAINNESANIYYSSAGTSLEIENCQVDFLAPNKNKYLNGTSAEAMNAISAVVQIRYKNKTFLFTGDSNEYNETELIQNCGDIDVLKVAHHGSSSSTTSAFLEITSPTYAVISVGEDNTYNMPSSNVINRLKQYMPLENIYRTDKNSTIIIGVDNNSQFVIGTYNYSANKIVWWQVIVGGEIALVIALISLREKKFNKPNKK